MSAVEDYFKACTGVAIHDVQITLDELRENRIVDILKSRQIRPRALALIEKIIEFLPPSAKVLDVGCGTGFFSLLLAEAGAYVLGVDNNQSLIRVANGIRDMERFSMLNCEFLDMPIEGFLKINPREFDATLLLNVFDQMLRQDEDEAWESLRKIGQRSNLVFMMTGATECLPNVAGIRTANPLGTPFREQMSSWEYGYEVIKRKGGFNFFRRLLRNNYYQRELWLFSNWEKLIRADSGE